jgi:energy-coupling factor transport system substrate-specific component
LPSRTRILAFIACFSAANAALRVALAGGPPNVKPTVFLTIVAGIVGGPVAGFAVGFLSMAVSDFLTPFGPGPWTIETSAGMAVVGLIGGWFWNRASSFKRWKLAAGGFLLAMLFDIATSVVDSIVFNYSWIVAVANLYVPIPSSGAIWYPFGLADELTTAFLLAGLGPSLISRIRGIYH